MEEETLFIVEKLAYRPRVVFMVLYCSILCLAEPRAKNLATEYNSREDRLDLGVHSDWEISKYLSAICVLGEVRITEVYVSHDVGTIFVENKFRA